MRIRSKTETVLIIAIITSVVSAMPCLAADSPPPFRIATFSLTQKEAQELKGHLSRQWLSQLVGSGTLNIEITALPELAYQAREATLWNKYDLLEADTWMYRAVWSGGKAPFRPFLQWSEQSRAKRVGVLLSRKEAGADENGKIAIVSPNSLLGGKVQLNMLRERGVTLSPGSIVECRNAQDVLRALKIGLVQYGALPADPQYTWGLPFDLRAHFKVIEKSEPQPTPNWFLSRSWVRENPAGAATLREALQHYFGSGKLIPIASLKTSESPKSTKTGEEKP
jgi:ABC transporter, phosphonate, periplasmic substrate-binding protein